MGKTWTGRLAWATLLGTVGSVAAACGGTVPEPKDPALGNAAGVPSAPQCTRLKPGTGAVRADTHRQGNAVSLVRLGTKTLAYVADEDSQSIHTIDVALGREVATTAVGGSPAQTLVLADGRVAVTLRDKNAVQILEPGENATDALTSRCTLALPAEPYGLAATPDDATLLVTSGWGHKLVALQTDTLAKKFEVELPREPRSVLVDDDGERAFVSHLVGGRMSVVDLTTAKHEVRDVSLSAKGISPSVSRGSGLDKWRTGTQGYALAKVAPVDKLPPPATQGELPRTADKLPPKKPAPPQPKPKARVLAPMVTVDPGDPGVRSTAYYGDVVQGVPRMAPMVSVVDPIAERSLTKSVLALGDRPSRQCVLPRAAAVRPSMGRLYVACLGIDAVIELDAAGLDPARLELRRISVPSGPTGIAVDDSTGVAVIWSQFDPGVTIVHLDNEKAAPVSVAVRYTPSASAKQLADGRKMFHHTDDSRIASDGVACASCHPDGREDSLTWATPDGPRQTIMLAGRQTSTAPYGWAGKHDNLPDYVAETFRRLGGTGLQGRDLDMLLTYVQGVPGPARGDVNTVSDQETLLAHGKELFENEQQGCATCHLGGRGVDKTLHDVGSTASADSLTKYDTPSLRFISGTAPYFHDGRYETLQDMLKASDHRMGRVLHMSQKDVTALAAYLETL